MVGTTPDQDTHGRISLQLSYRSYAVTLSETRWKAKAEAPDTLVQFMQDIGIPSHLHSDDTKELTQGRMGEIIHKCWIKATQSEPYSPWQASAVLFNCLWPKPRLQIIYGISAPLTIRK
jgi:hypothetical protein